MTTDLDSRSEPCFHLSGHPAFGQSARYGTGAVALLTGS
jgi:hypothetical protein